MKRRNGAMNKRVRNQAHPGFTSQRLESATRPAKHFWPVWTSQVLIVILLGAPGIAQAQTAQGETDQVLAPDESVTAQPERDTGWRNVGASVSINPEATTGIDAAGGHTPSATGGESAEDAALRAEIEARLSRAVIGKDAFQFTVREGVVTWTGETAVAQHKGAATRMARSAGAKQVVNRITVKGATPRKSRQGRPEASTHIRKAVVRWRSAQRH